MVGRSPSEVEANVLIQGGQSTDLARVSFPRALAEILRANLTGILTLTRGHTEYRVSLAKGAPVMVESTRPEDSLERMLIQKGKLEQVDAHGAKSESVSSGRPVGDVLVERGLLKPNEMYKLIKLNMGQVLLSLFSLTEAKVRFQQRALKDDGTVRLEVNPEPLIIRGVSAYSPFDIINKHFMSFTNDTFVLREGMERALPRLKLTSMHTRVVRALKKPMRTGALVGEADGDMEALLRLLYALSILGVVIPYNEEASPAVEMSRQESDDQVRAVEWAKEITGPHAPPPSPQPGRGRLATEELRALDDALATARADTHYDLLGVKPEASFGEIRRAFLASCHKLSPMALHGRVPPEREAQAEEVFLLLVRAYATLSRADLRREYNHDVGITTKAKKKTSGIRRGVAPFGPWSTPGHKAIPRPRSAAGPEPESTASGGFEVVEPYKPTVAVKTAMLLIKAGEIPEAILALRKALERSRGDAQGRALLGYLLYLDDPVCNMSDATAHLQRAAALDTSAFEPHLYMGRIFEYAQNRPSALAAYKQCLGREPRHKEAKAAVVRLHQVVQRRKE